MLFSGKYVLGLLLLIVALHVSAIFNLWYWASSWFDIPMHFIGGFWLAMVFAYLNRKFSWELLEGKKILLVFLLIVSFVALIGVFWEFFEFAFDFFFNPNQPDGPGFAQHGLADTIGDLFFDLLGGTVSAFVLRKFVV